MNIADIHDTSGLRAYITDKPRTYDAGTLTFGSEVTPAHIIPPGMTWETVGNCPSACTKAVSILHSNAVLTKNFLTIFRSRTHI